MPETPHVAVFLTAQSGGGSFHVPPDLYDDLKDRLDRRETGWIELPSGAVPGGLILLRLEDIANLFHATQEWCDAKNAEDEAAKLAGD